MALAVGVVLADATLLDQALAVLRSVRGDTRLFLMHDGVLALTDPRVNALFVDGTDVVFCAMDAEARGVAVGEAQMGSQYDHAVMVRDAARIITFTRPSRDPSDSRPTGNRAVLMEIAAPDALASSALRAALAMGALGLDVTVAAPAGLGALSPIAERARAALRIVEHRPDKRFDVVLGW